jgi:uncharacterized membrane protein HdeD (DUF308 family)
MTIATIKVEEEFGAGGPSMAGTLRTILGVILIVLGVWAFFLFYVGIFGIAVGVFLIVSGLTAYRQEKVSRAGQDQQPEDAYLEGA